MAMGPPTRVCCAPCFDVGFCRIDSNCCLECHMSFEERYVAPYLNRDDLLWLQQDHQRIQRSGFPEDMIRVHSEKEEQLFRQRNVPEDVLKQIYDDHNEWEQGQLLSRAQGGT